MRYREIELFREEPIASITLNRPKVLHALNETMKNGLLHALEETEEDDEIRVLVLTGRGRAFCAGADLMRFIEFQEDDKDHKKKSRFGSIDFPEPLASADEVQPRQAPSIKEMRRIDS